MIITITPVADTPVFTLDERELTTRQLIYTDFEKVTNWNTGSDTLHWFDSGATGGDAWKATPAKLGKVIGFEFFSRGDSITSHTGEQISVRPSPDGEHWLMLHDGVSPNGEHQAHQLLGIEHNITTIKDMIYTLSFDYSALPAVIDAESCIEIYAGDTLLSRYQGNAAENLDWQHLSYDFIGTGEAMPIKILLNGVATGDLSSTGRMAMIDNLSVVETLPALMSDDNVHLYALAGQSLALPKIALSSSDMDGSETYSLQIKGVPGGVSISDGKHTVTNTGLSSITIDLSTLDISTLSIKVPDSFRGDMDLTLVATSTEKENSDIAISTYGIKLTVLKGQPARVNSPYMSMPEAINTSSIPIINTPSQTLTVTPKGVAEAAEVTMGVATMNFSVNPLPRTEEEQMDVWLSQLERQAKQTWL